MIQDKWALLDSNQRASDYEPAAYVRAGNDLGAVSLGGVPVEPLTLSHEIARRSDLSGDSFPGYEITADGAR